MFRQTGFAALAAFAFLTQPASAETQTAIFAGGCFWCVESDFDKVEGVRGTVSGYIGGDNENPTYENHPGHREAVEITFDSDVVSFRELVDAFWRTVDVTDDGGQFCDRGHAYTTAVYAVNEEQAGIARESKAEAEAALGRDIVTPVETEHRFWRAEDYHQDYYQTNPVRYRYYRSACGRDNRVQQVWGDQAMMGIAGH